MWVQARGYLSHVAAPEAFPFSRHCTTGWHSRFFRLCFVLILEREARQWACWTFFGQCEHFHHYLKCISVGTYHTGIWSEIPTVFWHHMATPSSKRTPRRKTKKKKKKGKGTSRSSIRQGQPNYLIACFKANHLKMWIISQRVNRISYGYMPMGLRCHMKHKCAKWALYFVCGQASGSV